MDDDDGVWALDDQLPGPGGGGAPGGLAAVAGWPAAARRYAWGSVRFLAGLGLPGPDRLQGFLQTVGFQGSVPVQGLLLAVSVVIFVYLGFALFKPEWF